MSLRLKVEMPEASSLQSSYVTSDTVGLKKEKGDPVPCTRLQWHVARVHK